MKSLFLLLFALSTHSAFAQEGRNVAEYNLEASVGLKGSDPVSVFPEGGGKILAGKAEFRLVHSGVTYLFASEANLKQFQLDPEKYEPTYGGWCAYAMSYGSYVDIDTRFSTVIGRRAHYFISSRAKQNFDRKLAELEPQADKNWLKLSGEAPRK